MPRLFLLELPDLFFERDDFFLLEPDFFLFLEFFLFPDFLFFLDDFFLEAAAGASRPAGDAAERAKASSPSIDATAIISAIKRYKKFRCFIACKITKKIRPEQSAEGRPRDRRKADTEPRIGMVQDDLCDK